MVQTFARVSSNENRSPEFVADRDSLPTDENLPTLQYQGNEHLNELFEYHELRQALQQCKRNSSPGRDALSYEILKEIPKQGLMIILRLFNMIWKTGVIPTDWRHALIVPIIKPTKPNNEPTSYRPISLTSTLCKLMERLISNRICWYMETNRLFNRNQSGFRRNRGCIDQIMRLSDDINKSIHTKGSTVGIFVDLEKAYDMIWKDGLLHKLKNIGIRNEMYIWIENFLSQRTIQVKVGNELSDTINLDNGTPQGSVLSPVLFLIMINDIPDPGKKVNVSIFADDCCIWKAGKNTNYNARIVQEYFNKFQIWSNKWGLRISTTKTTAVVFSHQREDERGIKMMVGEVPIKLEKSVKFLGVILDKKLTWKEHIENVIERCKTRINLLRALSGTDWGSSKKTLLMLYRSVIRPIIDYGSIAYDSAAAYLKNRLNIIQSTVLRICCGAMRMTPVIALQIECGETSLELRRKELQLKYSAKLISNLENPTGDILKDCWQNRLTYYPHNREPFAMKTREIYDIIGERQTIQTDCYTADPFWLRDSIHVDSTLNQKIVKGKSSDNEAKKLGEEKIEQYSNTVRIFTDGSKNARNQAGISIRIPSEEIYKSFRIPDGMEMVSVEAAAILMALNHLEETGETNETTIFTDCLSIVNSIGKESTKTTSFLITEILNSLHRRRIKTNLVWIPSHVNIHENEKADEDARNATRHGRIELDLPISIIDANMRIRTFIDDLWQQTWNDSTKGATYREIEPIASRKIKYEVSNRRREVIQTRLRFQKCRLNHYLHQIGLHPDGMCGKCRTAETVEHYIMKCNENKSLIDRLNIVCKRQNIGTKLTDILQNVESMNIITDYIIEKRKQI